MKITGAEGILRSLEIEGVDIIFGYPGGAVLPIYDQLLRHNLKHVMTRHEQGAVHGADGYARSTGKVGVCLATSGPGATNLITGIATAYMDSVPLVIITGQVPSPLLGTDAFQEADITGITLPITKHNYLIKKAADIPKVFKEAFHIAQTGRPGPVLIDITKDAMIGMLDFKYPKSVNLRGYNPTYTGHILQITKAAEMIAKAKRPLILCGGGVIKSNAQREVKELSQKLGIPVISTLMGLGAIPNDFELFCGMVGMHGTITSNLMMADTDLIIILGARMTDRSIGKPDEFGAKARIIQVDIDPAEVGKNIRVNVPIVGDIKGVVNQLLELTSPCDSYEWIKNIKVLKGIKRNKINQGTSIKPEQILDKLSEHMKKDSIIVTDVGQHQIWTAQYYKFSGSNTFLTSGGLGTMGYGLPAAIGAKLANPHRDVLLITGDGSFQMNIQELGTILEHDLDIKILIMNNSTLGMVRQWQELFYQERYSSVDLTKSPNFEIIASAYGIPASTVVSSDQLEKSISDIVWKKGPMLLNLKIETGEMVFPIVPPGCNLQEMVGGGN